MAYTGDAVWTVSYSFRDNNGKTASVSANFSGAWLIADVEARALGLANALQDASDAYLASYTITRRFLNDSVDPKNNSSEVERKLLITGYVGPRPRTSYEVPSPIFGMEQPNTDLPNPANLQLAVLLAYLHDGSIGFANGPTDALGNSLTRVEAKAVRHRTRKPRN